MRRFTLATMAAVLMGLVHLGEFNCRPCRAAAKA